MKQDILHIILKKISNTPRHYYVFGFFVFCFFVILSSIFSYSVSNYDFYKQLADKQQIGQGKNPSTRGAIFSSTNNGTVLSTSVNLNDLAIDPTVKGDKAKLALFLTNIVYKHTCYLKTDKLCYGNILKFLKKLEIENFNSDEKSVKELIFSTIKQKISRTVVTSVLITDNLDDSKSIIISNLGLKGVYPIQNSLYVNPEEILNPDDTVEKLYRLVGIEKEDLKSMIKKRQLKYIPILNKMSIGLSEEINTYISAEREALKKSTLNEKNSISNFFILDSNNKRYFPEEGLASQLIGFVDNNGEGHYGIEGYFNDILKGNRGALVSRNDIKGRTIDPISLTNNSDLGGADIYTTIDRNVQKKVEEVLEAGVKKFRANKGMATVMDPKTGKIIAMANFPTYDSNYPGDVYELEKVSYAKYVNPKVDLLGMPLFLIDNVAGKEFLYNSKKIMLREIEREEFSSLGPVPYKYKNDFGPGAYQNDTISYLYEPGSIMKAITMAIGIDTGEINKYSTYEDKGSLNIDNFTIKNVSKECLGLHDYRHALDFSCNIGMIRIAQKLGKAIFYQYLTDFGFGSLTDITLEGEVYSKMDPYERWSTAKLFTNSYGLGINVTQLQMASAYSVIANGGLYVKPRIIDYIKYSDGRIFNYKTEVTHRVIKESTSKFMIDSLVESVEKGVAKAGRVEGYTVAGKTGTSVIPYKGQYKTENGPGTTNGSFAGFAPAEDPRFVMVITLVRPRGNTFGGGTSSEMFAEISKYLFDYYGIPKKLDTKSTKK